MSDASKFFQNPVAPKKKRERVPGSHISRCLDLKNDQRNRWPMSNLYIGGIGDLNKPEKMAESISEFWFPKVEEYDYNAEFYMGGGKISGERIANRLHKAGLTYYAYKQKEAGIYYSNRTPHQEYKILNAEYGWAGKIDIILDTNLVTYYGKKTRPEEKPTEKYWEPYEVKETSHSNYVLWDESSKFPKKYRTQLSLYIDDIHRKGIIKDKVGHFLLLSRDNPNAKRCCEYAMEQDLVEEAKVSATLFWKHIQERTYPKGFKDFSKKHIDFLIKVGNNEGRKWPKLAKVETNES